MSTMTNDETHEGSKNRETWAFNLHWQNDEGLYRETLEQVGDLLTRANIARTHDDPVSDWELGDYIVNYWHHVADEYEDEYGTRMPENLRLFRNEVGSWWRVDRAEVGEAVREALGIEEGATD